MKRIGITGKSGFIGTHLWNTLSLYKEKYFLIDFEDNFFNDKNQLRKFVEDCDCIVHLAALNRHSEPDAIYKTNISLVNKLIEAVENSNNNPHIIFASSSQEERNNPYGLSKQVGRKLFIEWARGKNGRFSGLIIPNVFGPFGEPFYNSFISTFSHQLTHNEEPKIEVDAEIPLIFIDELNKHFLKIIDAAEHGDIEEKIIIEETERIKVSEVLSILKNYRVNYYFNGTIPSIESALQINLFNTFRSYIDIRNHFPFKYKVNSDERGSFIETMKLNTGGQVSYSTTKPNITRGNHYHTRKIERFAVIKGNAQIKLRRINTNDVIVLNLNGEDPSFVDMPIWYTHNITNIGNDELITLFWINEFFKSEDPDTFYEEV